MKFIVLTVQGKPMATHIDNIRRIAPATDPSKNECIVTFNDGTKPVHVDMSFTKLVNFLNEQKEK